MKGTLSEAELFTLRTRLHEGRWNKARKGLLRFPLPIGYVSGPDGQWELDPDTQVRARLDYLFATFRRVGVARTVVRELKSQQLDLPTRVTSREGYGTLVWKTPTLGAVVRLLTNPAYAGAYVYGRCDYTGEHRSPKTGKPSARRRPRTEWAVCLPGHHAGYLSWEEFVQNQERLRDNWPHDGRPGVAREGTALLQGIVFCAVCGGKMSVHHPVLRERRAPTYRCDQAYRDGAARLCQSMSARPVDAAVSDAFLAALVPLSVELSRAVLDRIEHDLAASAANGSCNSTRCATRPASPSANTTRSIPTTDWWRGSWNGAGTRSWRG